MADTRKFVRGAKLSGKRTACQRIDDEVRRRARREPSRFCSLIMPSRTLHDLDLLSSVGVPVENSTVIERDSGTFEEIRAAVGGRSEDIMTSRPMELEKRVAMLRRPFDWMNLDLCGPIQRGLVRSVEHLAAWCFREGSCLEVTVKCARENKGDARRRNMLAELAESAYKIEPDQGRPLAVRRRELALFALLVTVPLDHGWLPSGYLTASYREDRSDGSRGLPMLCSMATGYRDVGGHADKAIWSIIHELWDNRDNG